MQNSEVLLALEAACSRFSRAELAKLLGRDPKTITRWRNGTTPPPGYLLPALQSMTHRDTATPGGEFTFIDLFAGIGGLRLGFESAGGKCIFTSEWNSYSQKTYRENFKDAHEISGDIVQIEASRDVPDHDLLIAGFPCQPFSLAGVSKKNSLGRPHGFECTTQGTLFFDVERIIAAKRPKAFVLENVKNLRSHDGGRTFQVIMDVLGKQLGYRVQARIIDGQHYVPQHRERILIIGFRDDVGFDINKLSVPELDSAPRLDSILHPEDGSEADLDDGRYIDGAGKVHSKYTLSAKLWQYLQDYAEKHRLKGNGFGYGLFGRPDVARTLSARYYKDGSEILIKRGKNARPRRLTPRECARLMGFPDSFKIPVSDTRAYQQFGNSVVVPAVQAMALHMKPHLMALVRKGDVEDSQQPLFAA